MKNLNKYNSRMYNMMLNEILDLGDCNILKVPGGWVYIFCNSSVFVPYNDEFKNKG